MSSKDQSRMNRRRQNKDKKKNKPRWKKIMRIALIAILVIGIGVGALFAYYIITAPSIDAEKLSDPFSSTLLDKDGNSFAALGAENRKKIEYDDLPDVLVDAVIATEDSRFFQHPGIDIRRIGGAIKANFTRGFGAEGASTITQQVAENAFLTNEKKIKLKVQEQWLALKLERQFTKEEILEMYLNKIFYGSNAYGVAQASVEYFDKEDLHDLTLAEAAILAGLPQRPSAYNPYQNPELTAERMNTVLNLMVRHGKITKEQADEASEVDVESLLAGKEPDSKDYEAFIQQVEKEIKEKVDGANIYTDGLTVHTTLDPDAQSHVEFLLGDSDDNPINYPEDVTDSDGNEHKMEAGLAVLDTSSGAIQAIGGSRDNDVTQNYALSKNRQPGSTYKPLLAYGPAIEYNKWSTYQQLNDDKPYELAGAPHPIRNWNREYQGWMSIRYALTWSLNVPTLKTIEEVGTGKAQEFAEGLGLTFDQPADVQAAIGSGEVSASPLQLAGAYQAFGNEGIHTEPYAVTKVEFPDGKTIDLKPEPEAAMSDYTAYMVTDMLKSVINEGTGTEANVSGLPVVGKTGTTTRDGVEGSPDSWFAGYTTNYTVAVWTGFKDNNIPLSNTKIPHALFKNIMTELSKDKETKDFVKPDSVVEVEVEKGSNPPSLPSDYTPSSNIVTELFVKGTEPTKTSDKYDKLDPVSNLSAQYNEDDDIIEASWDYDDDEDVTFEVSLGTDGEDMKVIFSDSEDKSIEITQVKPGSEYEIQVVAKKDGTRSEPKSTKVTLDDEDDDEEEMNPVEDLSAEYKADQSIIDVSWNYNGPPASFEVDVNGQVQTVSSNGIEISGAKPGTDYTITVTPIGEKGDNDGVKGESKSTTVQVPEDNSDEEGNNDEDNHENDSSNDQNEDENNPDDSDEG